ncbi:MAG: GntR family transcriptional regulator [Sedimentisphaerales bacterium]|nr:GntR family transcriptional regulator [Sedimentisphaerales bacterium]
MAVLNEIKLDKLGGKPLPLYEQIRRQVKQSIETRALKAGDRLPTVASLVKQWNVDYSTVKSAFDLLAEDGLLKLEPRRGAVVAEAKKSDVFTIMFVRWGNDALIVDIADGVQQYCSENGLEIICSDTRLSHENYLNAIAHPPQDIDGLILIPLDSPEYREAISRVAHDVKIVFVDRVLPDISVSSVTADHFAGGCRATEHLIKHHGMPAFYFGMMESPSSCHDRYAGWAAAMRQHNYHELEKYTWVTDILETNPKTFLGDIRQVPKELALRFLSENKQDRYSVFAVNDTFAQGLYLAAEELGYVIGKDIFVIGEGDSPLCEVSSPPQSSIYYPRRQLGYEAAAILHQDLSGLLRRPTHRVLPVELKVRSSSEGLQIN